MGKTHMMKTRNMRDQRKFRAAEQSPNPVSSTVKVHQQHICDSQCLKTKKPPKFSWVVEGLLAAHGRPTSTKHIHYLCDNNISLLISLTQNKPNILNIYSGGLQWVHISVKDEKPPTQAQVHHFINTVKQCQKQGKALSVHCAWGRGRTGTMLACYLALTHSLPAKEAINTIRSLRPKSIDTKEQEMVVEQFVYDMNSQKG